MAERVEDYARRPVEFERHKKPPNFLPITVRTGGTFSASRLISPKLSGNGFLENRKMD